MSNVYFRQDETPEDVPAMSDEGGEGYCSRDRSALITIYCTWLIQLLFVAGSIAFFTLYQPARTWVKELGDAATILTTIAAYNVQHLFCIIVIPHLFKVNPGPIVALCTPTLCSAYFVGTVATFYDMNALIMVTVCQVMVGLCVLICRLRLRWCHYVTLNVLYVRLMVTLSCTAPTAYYLLTMTDSLAAANITLYGSIWALLSLLVHVPRVQSEIRARTDLDTQALREISQHVFIGLSMKPVWMVLLHQLHPPLGLAYMALRLYVASRNPVTCLHCLVTVLDQLADEIAEVLVTAADMLSS